MLRGKRSSHSWQLPKKTASNRKQRPVRNRVACKTVEPLPFGKPEPRVKNQTLRRRPPGSRLRKTEEVFHSDAKLSSL
ncbi:hypothetical protein CEXT_432901 [Caerostris extrusa]|uniref:Uncharacterized protein n=1 Tax=Caerostris extrusa TaxID=172846 RepID=A0AAV4MMR0_CAEEX|nr:hypothetical protein CEXT_432901 [Caerostris extrusa]